MISFGLRLLGRTAMNCWISLLRLPWHSGGARKPVAVNYPAGKSDLIFLANGFTRQATLVWMESGSLDAGES